MVARFNLTTVLQLDREAPVTSYLNANDAASFERLDTKGYCVNFVYNGQYGPYNNS